MGLLPAGTPFTNQLTWFNFCYVSYVCLCFWFADLFPKEGASQTAWKIEHNQTIEQNWNKK